MWQCGIVKCQINHFFGATQLTCKGVPESQSFSKIMLKLYVGLLCNICIISMSTLGEPSEFFPAKLGILVQPVTMSSGNQSKEWRAPDGNCGNFSRGFSNEAAAESGRGVAGHCGAGGKMISCCKVTM